MLQHSAVYFMATFFKRSTPNRPQTPMLLKAWKQICIERAVRAAKNSNTVLHLCLLYMYIYTYTYIYIYVCTNVHANYIHVNICLYLFMYTRMQPHACMDICMYICTHTYVHICMGVCKYIYIERERDMYMPHIYMYTYV